MHCNRVAMKHVVCVKTKGNTYLPHNSNDESLNVLALFITDIQGNIQFFKDWVVSDSDATGGNIAWLEKKYNEIILFLDPTVFDSDVAFKSSKKQFLEILNNWARLYHEGWQEIIITQDNGDVQMTGKND